MNTRPGAGANANLNRLLQIPRIELEQLRPHLERVHLTPRDFYVAAGEPFAHVYFPYTAVIAQVVGMQSGDSVEVSLVGRLGMFGVSVLLGDVSAPSDGVCQVPGEAARLSVHAFLELTQRLAEFRRTLLLYSRFQMYEFARTAACNRVHTVEQRLARSLLVCSDQAGEDAYPLTQQAIARILGVRRPYVSRMASALQQAGLIQYRRGNVQILDRRGLETAACEDYSAVRHEYLRLVGDAGSR